MIFFGYLRLESAEEDFFTLHVVVESSREHTMGSFLLRRFLQNFFSSLLVFSAVFKAPEVPLQARTAETFRSFCLICQSSEHHGIRLRGRGEERIGNCKTKSSTFDISRRLLCPSAWMFLIISEITTDDDDDDCQKAKTGAEEKKPMTDEYLLEKREIYILFTRDFELFVALF